MSVDRATIFQGINIGVEADPGVAVPANKKLLAMGIDPSIQPEVDSFKPRGSKVATVSALNREWTQASVTGQPTYTEIVYPLSSVIDVATITVPVGAALARNWHFEFDPFGRDDPQTFTVDSGEAVSRAHRFAGALLTAFNMTFSRANGNDMGGTMIGKAITDAVAPEAAPTSIELVPILPGDVDVIVADTQAGLDAATPLNRAFTAGFSITDRFGPIWRLRSTDTSYVATVETDPTLQSTLEVEADAEGMGFLDDMRSGDLIFMRILATGPEIEAGVNYKFQVDMALRVTGVSEWRDVDGVFAIEWTFDFNYDPTWLKSFTVDVVNNLTEL